MRWTKDGIEWEASPKIAKNIVDKFESPGRKGKVEILKEYKSPGDPQLMMKQGADKLCTHEEKEFYMSVVQSCMYLSHDRADIAYAAKELARWSESHTQGHLASLRRLAGYIKAHRRVVNVFVWKEVWRTIEVFFW